MSSLDFYQKTNETHSGYYSECVSFILVFFCIPNIVIPSRLASGLFLVFHGDLDGYECQLYSYSNSQILNITWDFFFCIPNMIHSGLAQGPSLVFWWSWLRYSSINSYDANAHHDVNYYSHSNSKILNIAWDLLKYGFWKKSLWKNATLNSWTLSSSQKGTCSNES